MLQDSSAVVNDVRRLGEVLEDLLVAADPRRDAQHNKVDIGQLLCDVAGSAGAHASTVGVTISVDQRPQDSPVTLAASAPALRRAVLALVDNAIGHTPAGGHVLLRGHKHAQKAIIAVSDSGPGIPRQAARDIIRRFNSGGQCAGRQHFGLGLALTSAVADRHGGQLRLAAGTGGTTFELVLPLGTKTRPAGR